MPNAFLVYLCIENFEPSYHKAYNVVAVCGNREASVREANAYVAQGHRIAIATHGNEYGFCYFSRPFEEDELFSDPSTIGDTVYYKERLFSQTCDEKRTTKCKWSICVEQHFIRE